MFAREMRVRYEDRRDLPRITADFTSPAQAIPFLEAALERETVEVGIAVFLSTRHEAIAFQEISRGTINTTLIHPREVLKSALLVNAACYLVAHNHPSSNPDPSPDDTRLTDRLKQAGELIGIPLVDHIVIGGHGRYFSYRAAGLI